jgi:hypothetical protein
MAAPHPAFSGLFRRSLEHCCLSLRSAHRAGCRPGIAASTIQQSDAEHDGVRPDHQRRLIHEGLDRPVSPAGSDRAQVAGTKRTAGKVVGECADALRTHAVPVVGAVDGKWIVWSSIGRLRQARQRCCNLAVLVADVADSLSVDRPHGQRVVLERHEQRLQFIVRRGLFAEPLRPVVFGENGRHPVMERADNRVRRTGYDGAALDPSPFYLSVHSGCAHGGKCRDNHLFRVGRKMPHISPASSSLNSTRPTCPALKLSHLSTDD